MTSPQERALILALNLVDEALSKAKAARLNLEELLDEERGAPSAEEEIRAEFAANGEAARFPETDP